MKVFKDASGKTWTLNINVSIVKRCRACDPKVDLPGLFDDEAAGLSALTNDPVKFCELLYVIVQDEAKECNVSVDAFESAMSGDAINNAMNAFLEELIDFFPEPRKREAMKKMLDASRELQSKIMDVAESRMEEIDIGDIANRMTSLSGERPEFSDLIRDRLQHKN